MSAPKLVEPYGCGRCGIPLPHGQQTGPDGVHGWEQPSQEQVLARMKARRLARVVAREGALPMPTGPEPLMDDDRPLLPMGAHWTDVPELVDRAVDGIKSRVDQAQSGHWYVASDTETWRPAGTVRTNVDGYQRTVGQCTNMLPADLELVLHAHDDLSWCLDMIVKLRSRVAELEAQRESDHETWQHDLRTARTEREATAVRIAELEALTPARHQTCRVCGAGYVFGEPCAQCEFRARMAAESRARVRQPYRVGHDLPELGGQR